jgi:outer membrane protein TolC
LKFTNGLSTTTDVLAAERDRARAELALANAEGDADYAWLKLKKTVGAKPSLSGSL